MTTSPAWEHLPQQLAKLRAARRDPSAFLAFALVDTLNRPLQQSQLHHELQDFLTTHRKALVELPRDHGKTMQLCGRVLWELGHAPHLRIKLVCATDQLAWQRCRFLREQIAKNPRLRLVFPQLLPAQPWAAEGFTVQRPAEVVGPSLSAFGIGTGTTGARADLLICDDIVDIRSLHSAQERQRVKDAFHNNLMNLLEPAGRFWGLCTPWHPEDLNAELKANPHYAVFSRAIGPNLEPLWPEKWPSELLAARRAEIGEASFARGYRLLPYSANETMIQPEWVQYWPDMPARVQCERVVIAVDPAVSAHAKADATAFVAAVLLTLDCQRLVVIVQTVAQRWRTPAMIEALAAWDRHWQPEAILFESNAAFAGIRDVMVQRTTFGSRVQGITHSRSKSARIAALSVAVQNGSVRLLGTTGQCHPSQRELYEQLTQYPFASHDDLADACATAVEHLLRHHDPRVWV
jgi:predicted phage terminase large subunit-like protein